MNSKYNFDEEELEILEAVEMGTLVRIERTDDFRAIATATLKKDKKINIRLTSNDLTALQMRAAREGIPYQTLIGSVLHKYACGYFDNPAVGSR